MTPAITRAIAELSRTIREREEWLQHHGSNVGYELRLQAMKEALEIIKGVQNSNG